LFFGFLPGDRKKTEKISAVLEKIVAIHEKLAYTMFNIFPIIFGLEFHFMQQKCQIYSISYFSFTSRCQFFGNGSFACIQDGMNG
jgi:hypothetical protein